MPSGCLNVNIAKSIFPASRIDSVRGDSVRCCLGCSLILCIINVELTV